MQGNFPADSKGHKRVHVRGKTIEKQEKKTRVSRRACDKEGLPANCSVLGVYSIFMNGRSQIKSEPATRMACKCKHSGPPVYWAHRGFWKLQLPGIVHRHARGSTLTNQTKYSRANKHNTKLTIVQNEKEKKKKKKKWSTRSKLGAHQPDQVSDFNSTNGWKNMVWIDRQRTYFAKTFRTTVRTRPSLRAAVCQSNTTTLSGKPAFYYITWVSFSSSAKIFWPAYIGIPALLRTLFGETPTVHHEQRTKGGVIHETKTINRGR